MNKSCIQERDIPASFIRVFYKVIYWAMKVVFNVVSFKNL